MNWADARSRCREISGSLVIFHTAEENEFVISAVLPDTYKVWIGLSDLNSSEDWRWEDGSGLSFSKWTPGEPNNVNEKCVEFLNGLFYGTQFKNTWNDFLCEKSLPFICERRAKVENDP